MKHALRWIPLLAITLTSCARFAADEESGPTLESEEFGPTGIPPHLRARPEPAAGTLVKPGGNNPSLAGFKSTPLKDIVFTKAGDPDGSISELAELLAAPKAKTWEESDTAARARAAREGKPLLIWFTNSQASPNCKALSTELFSKPEFEAWANEKLVRLKVDTTFRPNDSLPTIEESRTYEIDVKHYVADMKKRYKVMVHPTLIMLSPSGAVLGRYVSYKRGTADFFWGQLKHAETVSSRTYADWRAGMEKKGYRKWQDRRGREIFAKLFSYANGELVLIDPEGSRFRTQETKLSDDDQRWIAEQKKLRNMP